MTDRGCGGLRRVIASRLVAALSALFFLAGPAVSAPDWRMAMADCLINDAAVDGAGVVEACGRVIAAAEAPDRLRARAALIRGQTFAARGAAALAVEDFGQAMRLDPQDPAARALRAGVRLAMQDRRGALADFDAAIALDPTYAPLRETRAAARFMSGDEAGALADWQAARRLDPARYPADATVRLLSARAARALELEDLAAARSAAEGAIERGPRDAVALSVLAAVSAAEGDRDGAVELFLTAMAADVAVGRGIEQSLQALGYDPGSTDGAASALTRHALNDCLADGCRLFRDPRFRFF